MATSSGRRSRRGRRHDAGGGGRSRQGVQEVVMKRARWVDLAAAAASVPDGAMVAPGGFMLGRAPMALIFELVRQGRRGLRVISLPNPLTAQFLVAAGAAARVELVFAAITVGGRVRPM